MMPMSDAPAAPALTYLLHFVVDPTLLFECVLGDTIWDERIQARRTANWGIAYNYSGISATRMFPSWRSFRPTGAPSPIPRRRSPTVPFITARAEPSR